VAVDRRHANRAQVYSRTVAAISIGFRVLQLWPAGNCLGQCENL
jgi:hypothetical protein